MSGADHRAHEAPNDRDGGRLPGSAVRDAGSWLLDGLNPIRGIDEGVRAQRDGLAWLWGTISGFPAAFRRGVSIAMGARSLRARAFVWPGISGVALAVFAIASAAMGSAIPAAICFGALIGVCFLGGGNDIPASGDGEGNGGR